MVALAEGLKSAGVAVETFAPSWKTNKPGLSLSPLWFNNPLYYLYSAWQISREVTKEKIDIIHVHGKYILPGAIISGWLNQKPVVITVRDFKFLCPLALCFIKTSKCSFKYFLTKEVGEYNRRYGKISKLKLTLAKLWQYQLKWWLNRAAEVIAVSPQLKKIYEENGVGRVTSIYNLPPRQQKNGAGTESTILSVGKLSYGKGTDKILDAAELLPRQKFIFAGELNPSLKKTFPKNCRYLGRLDHEAVSKLYSQAGVFVINSRWPEPLSRAGLEALAYGLPIVASNRGGNQELVKDNGFLVNPERPDQIARAITQAIKVQKNLGENSRKLLNERFNRGQIINRHLHLYSSLCSKF